MGLCKGNADMQGADLIDVNFNSSTTSLNPVRKKVWESLVKEGSKELQFFNLQIDHSTFCEFLRKLLFYLYAVS